MGKSVLDLADLEQLCAPGREKVTLSEEGLKEIWGAMKDKWREWFPTTYKDVESAELGVIKLLGELNEFGVIGNQIGDLVDVDFLKHFSEIDKLSFSFKSKKQIDSVGTYAKKAFSYYQEMCDVRRLKRCGTMEVYSELIAQKSPESKALIDLVEEFSRSDVLDDYSLAVQAAWEAIFELRNGSQIRSTLEAADFVEAAKRLKYFKFDTGAYLQSFIKTGSGYRLGLQEHENSLLKEKFYGTLVSTSRVMSVNDAYWDICEMLDALECETYDKAEDGGKEPDTFNEIAMRAVWQAFGMDFEKYLRLVTEQLRDVNLAMYTVRIACKELLTLHRLILQAKVAYLEAIIRRLRAADAVMSQEGLEDLLEDPRFNSNIPAQYRLAQNGDKPVEQEPEQTLSEEGFVGDTLSALKKWLFGNGEKKLPKNFDTDYTFVVEDYQRVLKGLKAIPELRKVADILEDAWLGEAKQLEDIASGLGVELDVATLCKAQVSELGKYLVGQCPYIYGTVESGTKMSEFFRQFMKLVKEGGDIASKLLECEKVVKKEGDLSELAKIIDSLYTDTVKLFGKVETDFPFAHFWESLEESVKKHTVEQFSDDLLSGKFAHLSVRGKNANSILGGEASTPWGVGVVLYNVYQNLEKHSKYVNGLPEDIKESLDKADPVSAMLYGLETCQYNYYDYMFDEVEMISVRGATKVGQHLLNEFENKPKQSLSEEGLKELAGKVKKFLKIKPADTRSCEELAKDIIAKFEKTDAGVMVKANFNVLVGVSGNSADEIISSLEALCKDTVSLSAWVNKLGLISSGVFDAVYDIMAQGDGEENELAKRVVKALNKPLPSRPFVENKPLASGFVFKKFSNTEPFAVLEHPVGEIGVRELPVTDVIKIVKLLEKISDSFCYEDDGYYGVRYLVGSIEELMQLTKNEAVAIEKYGFTTETFAKFNSDLAKLHQELWVATLVPKGITDPFYTALKAFYKRLDK